MKLQRECLGQLLVCVAIAHLLAALCACQPLDQPSGPSDADLGGACVAQRDAAEVFFADRTWPDVVSRCAACHIPGGQAQGARFLLKPPGLPDALAQNAGVLRAAAQLVEGGQPLLLLKPTAQVAHGGGQLFVVDSPAYATLAEQLRLFASQPATGSPCAPGPGPSDPATGVQLLDEVMTLRKAALQLAGRVPTADEVAQVQAGGLPALDAVLAPMMQEDAFYERLREIFNDVLYTDANLYEQSYDGLIAGAIDAKLFPGRSWYGSAYNNINAVHTANAIAREPLEFILHAVKTGRPLTEILTARYRLVNPWSAKVFGLTPTFRDPTDRNEFVEVQLPALHGGPDVSEYAGILTTTSFLYRYPSTSTNRNRKRARFFYKFFLNFDIMKSAQRVDLSLVDFNSDPWRNNSSCTGCHSSIDPVAGAFLNFTDCYDNPSIRYFKAAERYCARGPLSWFPGDKMFPPGTGAGAANELPLAKQPIGLTVLSSTVVGNPGFAEAIAGDVLAGLTGWPIQPEPVDTTAPDYASTVLAFSAQKALIGQLATAFARGNYDLRALVLLVVKSAAFRAGNADRAGRLELAGQGGGALTPPELLHRKIQSVLGAPWGVAGSAGSPLSDPYHLLAFDKLRVPYGGIDSRNVLTRQVLPSALNGAASQRMAYEMACEYTAVDLAGPRAGRRLFPHVERTQVPTGDPVRDAAILQNLQHLHERVLGERLSTTDPALRESYQLLLDLLHEGQAALAEGRATATLPATCQSLRHFATGQVVPGGFSDDANYVVRAWQGVIAYLLMDYRFLYE